MWISHHSSQSRNLPLSFHTTALLTLAVASHGHICECFLVEFYIWQKWHMHHVNGGSKRHVLCKDQSGEPKASGCLVMLDVGFLLHPDCALAD